MNISAAKLLVVTEIMITLLVVNFWDTLYLHND